MVRFTILNNLNGTTHTSAWRRQGSQSLVTWDLQPDNLARRHSTGLIPYCHALLKHLPVIVSTIFLLSCLLISGFVTLNRQGFMIITD